MKRHKLKQLVAACMLGALSISLCLFGGGTEALATDEPRSGSVTIENAIEGRTYNFYKVADLKMTDSGNPEDGVSYTMSADQYKKYAEIVADYDITKEEYESYKKNPEQWNEESMGMDYDSGMVAYEEMLSAPILVKDTDAVHKVVLRITDTTLKTFPRKSLNNIYQTLYNESPDFSFTEENENVFAENLPFGYYIIIPDGVHTNAENALIPINLTNVTPNKVVKSKTSPFSIKKSADVTNVEEGQFITFTIEGVIPNVNAFKVDKKFSTQDNYQRGDYALYLADTMQGLQFTGNWTLSVDGSVWDHEDENDYAGGNPDAGMEIEYAVYGFESKEFENINFHTDKVEAVKSYLENIYTPTARRDTFCFGFNFGTQAVGKPFKLTYTALLKANDEDYIHGSEGNTNTAMAICYDLTSDGTGYEIYTAEAQETIYTYDINVLKHATGDTSDVLPGAEFELYKLDENNTPLYYFHGTNGIYPTTGYSTVHCHEVEWASSGGSTVTTGANGKAVFTGLTPGTYYLKEVKAPEGYNVLEEPIKVILPAGAPADFTVEVENSGGALLPETGGPGTTPLFILGLFLTATSATIYFTTRKKHS